ncbi:MAG: DUF1007 family protein, partial [Spirochaetaceae bacterium]|nr:DUF1007 family protein [Spirochaetaceae bacterium]
MRSRLILLISLFLLIQHLLPAHPHMWIQGKVEPILGKGGLEAVDISWKFDEYSNAGFIRDFDRNKDGIIDADESESIRQESLAGLYESEYYLIIDIDGLRAMPLEVQEFQASIDNGQLTWKFRVPLEIPIRWGDLEKVGIFLFDPSYFVDFRNDGMTDFTAIWENHSIDFSLGVRELETRGFGRVAVPGLQGGKSSGLPESRISLSALIKEKSFLLQERLGSYTR